MHRFYVIILFLACFPAVWAEETPTQTREEKLIDIEIGTLTATNDTQPSDLLITVKTNKQSYYLLQSFGPFGMTEGAALNLASIIAKGKSIAEQGGAACFVLHLLFPLRPDDTPDNAQANAGFYPDRNLRAKFNSYEWASEKSPKFNGLFLSEMPSPKMPASLGGAPVTYKRANSIGLNVPCIIEIQENKPKQN